MNITGLFESVLVFPLTNTAEESPVICTSLSVCYELWLDSREEVYTLYFSSRVVHDTSHQMQPIFLFRRLNFRFPCVVVLLVSFIFHVYMIKILPGK